MEGQVVLRKAPNAQASALKEKFVDIFECFFRGEDASRGQNSDTFWQEVFLLKVNVSYLERCIILTSEQQLLGLRDILHLILTECCNTIQRGEHALRCRHALEIICVMLRSIFRKTFTNFGVDIVNLLGGMERGDALFKSLIDVTSNVLRAQIGFPLYVKECALLVITIIVTATDNVNQNALIEYVIIADVFDVLCNDVMGFCERHGSDEVPGDAVVTSPADEGPTTMDALRFRALSIIMLLITYRKYETANSCVSRLTRLQDAPTLHTFAAVVKQSLQRCCHTYDARVASASSPLSMLTASIAPASASPSLLSSSASPSSALSPSSSSSAFGVFSRFTGWIGNVLTSAASSSRESDTDGSQSPADVGITLLAFYELVYLNKGFFMGTIINAEYARKGADVVAGPFVQHSAADAMEQLMVLCSYIFVDVKDARSALYAKICFLILITITEDNEICKWLHDPANAFDVPPAIHKKSKSSAMGSVRTITPVVVLLDVLMEFLKNNVHDQLQVDLHHCCLRVFHHILCYQRHFSIRLEGFEWSQLWSALFRIVKFISRDHWLRQAPVQLYAEEITKVLNLFITYGDTFLPVSSDYDFLYYELLRVSRIFHAFQSLVEKVAPNCPILQQMENIRTITHHFRQKIDKYAEVHPEQRLTPQQVTSVIVSNYETLKLTLLDHLDEYDKYVENPTQVTFFRQFVRSLVIDYKTTIRVQSYENTKWCHRTSVVSPRASTSSTSTITSTSTTTATTSSTSTKGKEADDGVIRAVHNLIADLSNADTQLSSARALRELTREDVDARDSVREAGGIPPLVQCVRRAPDCVKEHAAAVLHNLAIKNKANRAAIRAAGGIPPLVECVRSDSIAVKIRAIGALHNVAVKDVTNRDRIHGTGGIPLLVECVRHDHDEVKEWAARALGTLAIEHAVNRDAIREAGGVSLLVQCVRNGSNDVKKWAARALGILTLNYPINCKTAVYCGALAALQTCDELGVEHAGAALSNLTSFMRVSLDESQSLVEVIEGLRAQLAEKDARIAELQRPSQCPLGDDLSLPRSVQLWQLPSCINGGGDALEVARLWPHVAYFPSSADPIRFHAVGVCAHTLALRCPALRGGGVSSSVLQALQAVPDAAVEAVLRWGCTGGEGEHEVWQPRDGSPAVYATGLYCAARVLGCERLAQLAYNRLIGGLLTADTAVEVLTVTHEWPEVSGVTDAAVYIFTCAFDRMTKEQQDSLVLLPPVFTLRVILERGNPTIAPPFIFPEASLSPNTINGVIHQLAEQRNELHEDEAVELVVTSSVSNGERVVIRGHAHVLALAGERIRRAIASASPVVEPKVPMPAPSAASSDEALNEPCLPVVQDDSFSDDEDEDDDDNAFLPVEIRSRVRSRGGALRVGVTIALPTGLVAAVVDTCYSLDAAALVAGEHALWMATADVALGIGPEHWLWSVVRACADAEHRVQVGDFVGMAEQLGRSQQ